MADLEALKRLFVPKIFVGPRAWLLGGFVTLCAAAYTHYKTGWDHPDWKMVGIVGGATLVVVTVGLVLLRMVRPLPFLAIACAHAEGLAGESCAAPQNGHSRFLFCAGGFRGAERTGEVQCVPQWP